MILYCRGASKTQSNILYGAFWENLYINPLTTNVPHYIETIQLICNQLTGFYIIGNIVR